MLQDWPDNETRMERKLIARSATIALTIVAACNTDAGPHLPCYSEDWAVHTQLGTGNLDTAFSLYSHATDGVESNIEFMVATLLALDPNSIAVLEEALGAPLPRRGRPALAGKKLDCGGGDYSSFEAAVFSVHQTVDSCRRLLESKQQQADPAGRTYFWLAPNLQYGCPIEGLPPTKSGFDFSEYLHGLHTASDSLNFQLSLLQSRMIPADVLGLPETVMDILKVVGAYLRDLRLGNPTLYESSVANRCFRELIIATVAKAGWTLKRAESLVENAAFGADAADAVLEMELAPIRSLAKCE